MSDYKVVEVLCEHLRVHTEIVKLDPLDWYDVSFKIRVEPMGAGYSTTEIKVVKEIDAS